MKRIIVVVLLINLSACGILPHINCDKAQRIKVGMTEQELISALGDPYVVKLSLLDKKVTKVLGWQDKELPRESSNLLRVKISEEGKVTDFSGNCAGSLIKAN